MDVEEELLITPAAPPTKGELEIVGFHKFLTECWQKNSQPRMGTTPRAPCLEHPLFDHTSSFVKEDSDFDGQLKAFLEERGEALIPKELLYTNRVVYAKHQVDNKSFRQRLTNQLRKIEMKEKERKKEKREKKQALKTEDSEPDHMAKSEGEISLNDMEDSMGDYKYSFCEEEDLDNENDYF